MSPSVPYTPGVQVDVVAVPAAPAGLRTGVPAFLAYATGAPPPPAMVTRSEQVVLDDPTATINPFLATAVRGFFDNGGEQCQVVWLDPRLGLRDALSAAFAGVEDVDLVCAPSPPPPFSGAAVKPAALQAAILDLCARRGDCFALLDPPQGVYEATGASNPLQQHLQDLRGQLGDPANASRGALYYPWLQVAGGTRYVPPSGHVAGIYTRTDRSAGVFKAPANEELEGVVDLERPLLDPGGLNQGGINGLRAIPGRGIRVMGARTLSQDPAWRYVNVRRLLLTVGRWLARTMDQIPFEPNDMRLWVRLTRELDSHLEGLFRQGALKGATPQEAFYVKCDEETNPPEARDAGKVTVEVGLAPATPREFIIVRLVQQSGITGVQPV